MEQTALRPKPLPGSEPAGGARPAGGAGPDGRGRRPHAARRRGRRLTTLLFGLVTGTVLVLSGVGLGTVGATVIGMSRLAELQRQAGQDGRGAPGVATVPGLPGPATPDASSGAPAASRREPGATLGLEAVDAPRAGAEIVAVHVPGPGHTAGLLRGDVLLKFGGTRIDSAMDLARAVDAARPGVAIKMTVRHHGGGYDRLTVIPGIVT
ncbi:PDZ domain-containing protein [Streptomyces maremycinicus]|uniref:PDZ domain-containing protein n=1 Tax=Streptomyces maremycinicus TaxID=1679753 RepID=UPI00078975FF|nr:PDZ domain-containing protein [Streptomyces sp. NBRC 110468]